MNEKNYDYLKNQIKFSGFGEELDAQLKAQIEKQSPAFQLEHRTKFGQDEINSTLYFSRSKESDLYFFNKFDLEVKKEGQEAILKQSYYIGRENNLTLKERYNLLEGRAVFKEFNRLEQVGTGEKPKWQATEQTYNAWTELNFTNTDGDGNFLPRKLFWDHERSLNQFPIKELADTYERSRLLASLEKGNVQRATVNVDGKDVKVNVTANPQLKTFIFFDSNMQKLEVKTIQQQQKEGQDQDQKKQQSHSEKQTEASQKQGRKNQIKVS